ncbi:MAG TPA: hypothetical protein VI911_05765 [Patescibacteria group bacterium]|nr:hypothetical protein [Patescibacteria group bacterium]
MKKIAGILFLIVILASCEKLTDKCYICETRKEVGTTLETSEVYEITGIISVREYERQHSSVVIKQAAAGPYYSQTITICKEK